MSNNNFKKGDMVWVMPWEASLPPSEAWPLGHRVVGVICSESKKVGLVGESYEVIVNGVVKTVPRDGLEKVEQNE